MAGRSATNTYAAAPSRVFGGFAPQRTRVVAASAVLQSDVTIYSFTGGQNGAQPTGGLVQVGSLLYGTTTLGGACGNPAGCGTIFAVGETSAPGRVVKWSKVYTFTGGSDGAQSQSSLSVVGSSRTGYTLFGTAPLGGVYAAGTLFACALKTPTLCAPSIANGFLQFGGPPGGSANGAQPYGGLYVVGAEVYGTTLYGGANGAGTAFQIGTNGKGYATASFPGGSGGTNPKAGVTGFAGSSELFGTTSGGVFNGGTVFALNSAGKIIWSHPFAGQPDDGAQPLAPLLYLNGFLYGTTYSGGAHNYGSVFRIPISGGKPMILHSFSRTDGAGPDGGLTYVNGYLYGTTSYGLNFAGNVFKMSPSGATFSVLHYFYGSTQQNPTDGAKPSGPLTYVQGLLYGTTQQGGGPNNAGTIFAVTP